MFKLLALLALCAALYHGVGLFAPINDAPKWRHALFIAIDLYCACGFIRRPLYFVWSFAVLAAQQCFGHGKALVEKFAGEGHLSWIDLSVVIFMPVALIALIAAHRRDVARKHEEDRRRA